MRRGYLRMKKTLRDSEGRDRSKILFVNDIDKDGSGTPDHMDGWGCPTTQIPLLEREQAGGTEQHIDWVDMLPESEMYAYSRDADFTSKLFTWDGVPSVPFGKGAPGPAPEKNRRRGG